MLRLRPGLLLILALVTAAWVWQYKFREYSPFSGSDAVQEQQREFRRYALGYYPVKELEYHGENEIWVRLTTTHEIQQVDAQRIVEAIADDYSARTGFDQPFTVYLLHPIHQDVVARATR